MKILLILSDGTRPDSLEGIEFIEKLKRESTYSMAAQTVMPSVTLPCHMSLFHSVDPSRHGTTTNTYAPQVRPISGLFEQLKAAKKKCAMFYNWEQLRDLSRPGNLSYSEYVSMFDYGFEESNEKLCEDAVKFLNAHDVDFTFLYLGWVDEAGHDAGWMGEKYMHSVRRTCDEIERTLNALSDEYVVIFTADHGGHERSHGTDLPEDMTIPLFFCGAPFEKGKALETASIKDIAPTGAHLLGAEAAREWEGRVIE